jgi:PKD domain
MRTSELRFLLALILLAVAFLAPTGPIAAQENQSQTATFGAQPTSALVGDAVTFTYSAGPPAQPGATITGITIDFGDGDASYQGSAGPGQGVNGVASHIYLSAGNYQAGLEISLSDGTMESGSASVNVSERPASASAGLGLRGPSSGQTGDLLSWQVSSGPGSPAGSLRIAYGDGTADDVPLPGALVSHSYAQPGIYVILLTQLDSAGGVVAATSSSVQISGS